MNDVTIGWIAASLGVFGYAIAQVMYSWDMYEVRRRHTRFPMFAARDHVVLLVAEGCMDEKDPAWALVYAGTNVWLSPRRNYSIWHQLFSYMRHEKRMQSDRKLARRVEQMQKALVERAMELPEFGEVVLQIESARRIIMRGQTHWWDRLAIRVLLSVLHVLHLITRLFSHFFSALRRGNGKTDRVPAVRLRPRDVYKISDDATQSKPDILTSVDGLIAWSAKVSSGREHRAAAN